jgi:hypothetical protein
MLLDSDKIRETEIRERGGRSDTPPSFQHASRPKHIGKRAIKHLSVTLLAVAVLSAAPSKHTFTGIITDDVCPKADHSQMQMGPTDATCALNCVDIHGAALVLYDGKNTYSLSDQRTPQQFAAKKVSVVGTLDAKTNTIQVDSITAAK